MLGPHNAIWDDGEWISWRQINSQLAEMELQAKYPKADLTLVPFFEDLLQIAEEYHLATDSHLQVYGDIGELFGAITYGIKLHRNYAQGSDGWLGNDPVEIKTITPFKARDEVTIRLDRNFSKLLVVRIDEDFQVSGRMIRRKSLGKPGGKRVRLTWTRINELSE